MLSLSNNFLFHKKINVSLIKEDVSKFNSEWLEDTSRQHIFDVHKHTSTIQITDFDLDWECFSPYVYKPVLKNKKLFIYLKPIFNYLENLHDGKIGRSMFVKLLANKNIDKHIDGGAYLLVAKRHHIPIITNSKVLFIIDGEQKNLDEGEIWEIDNSKEHEVKNLSNEDRVHLIVDIIPNMYINKQHV